MVPGRGDEDAPVGPSICEITSDIPWEWDMGGKKGEGGIIPEKEILCGDFAGKGSLG